MYTEKDIKLAQLCMKSVNYKYSLAIILQQKYFTAEFHDWPIRIEFLF